MKHLIRYLSAIGLILLTFDLSAQIPKRYNSSEIYKKIQKLNVLGNALYIAAHPDDENTRLITYLSNAELINTAYLSLTRGDGGQNSIGPEQSELLGVIRTQELLSARKVDGGRQFFTRVMDFGYSKSAEETVRLWNKEAVLEDVVWIVRKFRPDVVITRFPADRRAGHGQHETSAIIAAEAFELAADPAVFPEQLEYVDIWQPSKLFLNTGRWWNQNIHEGDSVISLDIGKYDPLSGLSYSELGADSRSQHRSQAFGVTWTRGTSREYLEYQKGIPLGEGIFDGIDISWGRAGSDDIQKDVVQLLANYDFTDPAASIQELIRLRRKVEEIVDDYWRETKLHEIDQIIRACAGLYLEATSNRSYLSPGDSIDINVEITNRSDTEINLERIIADVLGYDTLINRMVFNNTPYRSDIKDIIDPNVPETSPYWLNNPVHDFKYDVPGAELRGVADNPPSIEVEVVLTIEGEKISYLIPVVYTWTDRMKGQQYEPLEIGPKVFVDIDEAVFIFPDDQSKNVTVKLETRNQPVHGKLFLDLPDGWQSEPAFRTVSMAPDEVTYSRFELIPPSQPSIGSVRAMINVDGMLYDRRLVTIEYEHFPKQSIYLPAEAKAERLDIHKKGSAIAYIDGAGDEVGPALEQIGYKVNHFNENNIHTLDFHAFDAIVFGIMAFNNNEYLADYETRFLDFIREGGNVIVQYNNIRIGTKSPILQPYPIEFSRSSASVRVSVEDAEVRILAPDHEVMNTPNQIDSADFEGWIQERGLYFPVSWDESYTPVLSSNDPGEDPLDGGLLVAKYGKGYFVYTTYSWFRQLPAGVPGAFRLFANMISLGKNNSLEKNNSLGKNN